MMGQNPVAAFTANKTSGCAPLTVSFTDQSTGGVLFWNWDFGNGTLSSQQNPVVVYNTPGVYTVKIAVRNANGADGTTKTNYIRVFPSPVASFTVNSTIGCNPSTFQFTDLSYDTSGGSITKWNWTFSDGTTSTTPSPQKQFTSPGYYDVSLVVTSTTGCTGAEVLGRLIRIVPGVVADFTYTQPTTCQPPFGINFTSQTSGPGTLTYNWDFGNSTTSTKANDSATYTSPGSYTVKLTAQSSYGCQNTAQKTIVTSNTLPTFTSTGVCIGSPTNFQNTSSPAPASVLWKFGDNTTSTLQNPVKTYPAPGSYPVTLVGNYTGCTDSVTKTVTINSSPVVDFTAPRTRTCKPNLQVDFKDISPNAKTWNWSFGDGGTSTLQNPSHTYTALGQFNVTLTITDSNGCQNSLTKYGFVQISAPQASIGNVPDGGCAPYTFTAHSNSQSAEGIASYFWDFGDGHTSTLPTPTNTYASTGNYTIILTVTTVDGCTSTLNASNAVRVGTPAAIDFSNTTNPVCRSSFANFNDLTVPSGLPVLWKFGDGDSSYNQNPSHKYNDTGSYSITLIAINNGCQDTLTKPGFIKVLGPVARFNYTVDCATKTLVSFRDSSIVYPPPAPVPTYTWFFDDPLNTTASGTPLLTTSFDYPAAWGVDYNAHLVVNDGTCSDTATRIVRIVNETPNFTISKSPACRNDLITLTSGNSILNVKQYTWKISGGTGGVANVSGSIYKVSFANAGTYTVELDITDIHGCVTLGTPQSIVITGPTPAFSIANDGGCKNKPVQFTDHSVIGGGPITGWSWTFGDGSGTFTGQNISHTYADTGIYNVTLIVSDALGCAAALTIADTITQPHAAFGTDTTLFCPGGPMQFKDSSLGRRIQSWTWDFGDGGSATLQNPVHTYTGGDAVYSVKLVIGDAFGCTDSVTRTNYITIKKPKPAFGVKDSTTICPPLQTSFFFQGKDYQSYSWDFGDGGTSTLANPTHFYNGYGADTVKLYIVGFGGCLDSASSVVHIYNPYQTTILNYGPPLTACNQLHVDFNLVYPPSTKVYFYFGDGAIDSSQQTFLQHQYNTPSFNTPIASLIDSEGCYININGLNIIKVLGAVPVFGMDQKKFCDSGVVAFSNFTINNDPLVSETWNFGDGDSTIVSTPANAIHMYLTPGLYVTSLTATTAAGCVKALTDTVRVLRTPDPLITSVNNVCINGTINFQGDLAIPDTAITWKWDLGGGQTSNQQQVSVTFPNVGNYTVRLQAANSLGCKDTTSKTITVNPPPSIGVNGDTTLVVGTGINIPMVYGPGVVSYSWTPAQNLSCTDCASPYANPIFTTTYQVVATDSNNCSSSRYVTLITLCNNKNFFIPNTFTPNGDGVNDVFYPRGTGLDRIQGMRIFNRWGELIFEKRFFAANDPSSGWDGTYKGKPSNSDTYIYMIDIICENATIITYKGNVTLIR